MALTIYPYLAIPLLPLWAFVVYGEFYLYLLRHTSPVRALNVTIVLSKSDHEHDLQPRTHPYTYVDIMCYILKWLHLTLQMIYITIIFHEPW